ncbi:hypothetical protein HPHPP23_1003 [Helicobacter pylori Hp P-23]|uniref:Uncharacterized protein n=1 Tax=Helicobacter pylori Hp P-15 TaxID=992080 RepID=I9WNZ4_HELPX|nr:hypothetical protein HPHPH27_1265 [Helicobacter pylori Hp H-27]EJC07627.1 hypothetical protein HPHPP15_0960 [Helicobacter pylori Hp P-15]EJC12745.1 hypothetical protein HPHPP23_1003 [Helicobacter pylori Hp P-23]EJC16472.1 hypothetical protein HPHPP74_1283 [Helicobacter pylori Hp P-74]EJC32395.1 hypothetical protein HPHPP15B_1229 [Helicobacter pylori Hp P-15b]
MAQLSLNPHFNALLKRLCSPLGVGTKWLYSLKRIFLY